MIRAPVVLPDFRTTLREDRMTRSGAGTWRARSIQDKPCTLGVGEPPMQNGHAVRSSPVVHRPNDGDTGSSEVVAPRGVPQFAKHRRRGPMSGSPSEADSTAPISTRAGCSTCAAGPHEVGRGRELEGGHRGSSRRRSQAQRRRGLGFRHDVQWVDTAAAPCLPGRVLDEHWILAKDGRPDHRLPVPASTPEVVEQRREARSHDPGPERRRPEGSRSASVRARGTVSAGGPAQQQPRPTRRGWPAG
jgi:hypothetical protein